eukprot:UN20674
MQILFATSYQALKINTEMQFAQGYARRRKRIYAVKRCGFSHFSLLWDIHFARISYRNSL